MMLFFVGVDRSLYRTYDSTNMWFRCQLEMLAPLVREAFETRDIDLLRGLQALAVTIWMGVRGVESIVDVMVGKALERLDPSDRTRDGVEKITVPWKELRWTLKGLSLQNVPRFLRALVQLGFLEEHIDPDTGSLVGYSLTRIWNWPVEEMKARGKEVSMFVSDIGILLALSVLSMGVRSFRPVIVALNRAEENEGQIACQEMLGIYIGSIGGRLAGRTYYELCRRDNMKDSEIRLIASNDGKIIIFSPPVFRVLRRLNELALRRYREITGE